MNAQTRSKQFFTVVHIQFWFCPNNFRLNQKSKIKIENKNRKQHIHGHVLKRSKGHKYCKKAINFPTDFSLAHCGKEISLKDPKLRLAGAGGA